MGLDNPSHIAILVVVLLLVFGAKRLPEIGRSLGSGMREFKDSVSGEAKPQALPPVAPATVAEPAPVQQAPVAVGATQPPAQAVPAPAAQNPGEPNHQA